MFRAVTNRSCVLMCVDALFCVVLCLGIRWLFNGIRVNLLWSMTVMVMYVHANGCLSARLRQSNI